MLPAIDLDELGESCNDGDAQSRDGCSSCCQPEPGYVCAGAPSLCTPGLYLLLSGTAVNGSITLDVAGVLADREYKGRFGRVR